MHAVLEGRAGARKSWAVKVRSESNAQEDKNSSRDKRVPLLSRTAQGLQTLSQIVMKASALFSDTMPWHQSWLLVNFSLPRHG